VGECTGECPTLVVAYGKIAFFNQYLALSQKRKTIQDIGRALVNIILMELTHALPNSEFQMKLSDSE